MNYHLLHDLVNIHTYTYIDAWSEWAWCPDARFGAK